jgi:hypothetical protein
MERRGVSALAQRGRHWLVACVLMGIGACGNFDRMPLQPPDPYGVYRFTGAMSPRRGGARDRRTSARTEDVELSSLVARHGADTCARPSYQTELVDADSLLSIRLGVTLESLGYAAAPNHVFITRVKCNSLGWAVPAGVLIWKQRSRNEFYLFENTDQFLSFARR